MDRGTRKLRNLRPMGTEIMRKKSGSSVALLSKRDKGQNGGKRDGFKQRANLSNAISVKRTEAMRMEKE